MNSLNKLIIAAAVSVSLSNGAFADEDNYNPFAGGNGDGDGAANANCQSALIQSCDAISTAPAPAMGGIGFLGLVGFALYKRRRQATLDRDV